MARILYVEDDEMNRDMLSRRLTRREHEISLAFDGYGVTSFRWMGSYHSS